MVMFPRSLLACLLVSGALLGGQPASAQAPAALSPEQIAQIVAAPDRTAADRTNDLRRKPEPMLGFIGKLVLFRAVLAQGYVWLAVIGLINGAISLYYYAKPLMKMYLDDQATEGAPRVVIGRGAAVLATALVLPVIGFFLYWSPLADWVKTAAPALGFRP